MDNKLLALAAMIHTLGRLPFDSIIILQVLLSLLSQESVFGIHLDIHCNKLYKEYRL